MTTPNPNSEQKKKVEAQHIVSQNSFPLKNTEITTYLFTSTMKLHLLLLASLFNLSSGFVAELRGPLTEEACTGEEYADFLHCATLGAAADPSLPVLAQLDQEAFVNRGGERKLGWCSGCRGGAPRGTFCFTVCGGRRLSEEGTDTPNLRRLQQREFVAAFEDGAFTGNGKSKRIAKDIIECLGAATPNHPCLGSTDTMTLTVTL
jgi:hypothetical protein